MYTLPGRSGRCVFVILGAGATVPVAEACARCSFLSRGIGNTKNRHCFIMLYRISVLLYTVLLYY